MPDMGAVMAEIHEAIQKRKTVGDRQPGEFTANEYAEDRGMAASRSQVAVDGRPPEHRMDCHKRQVQDACRTVREE